MMSQQRDQDVFLNFSTPFSQQIYFFLEFSTERLA